MRLPAPLASLKHRLGIRAHWRVMIRGVRELGLKGAVRWYASQRRLKRDDQSNVIALISKNASFPLLCRAGTSDCDVFRQVFIEQHYAFSDPPRDPSWIVDCGANVGYSAAFFLSRFPACRLIAVEPDCDNVALLRRNLAPYGERVRVFHAGVWSHAGSLMISGIPYRDGLPWARQVRECLPGEVPSLQAMDMETVLAETQGDRISILKMDIEGAEAVVFDADCSQWLAKVDTLLIELHDDTVFGQASQTFANSIAGQGFDVMRHGEITVCKRTVQSRLQETAGRGGVV